MNPSAVLSGFKHFFVPHPHTHEKAKLLQWHFLLIYLSIFVVLQIVFSLLKTYEPGVLGTTSSITIEKVIEETNKERAKHGLAPLRQNPLLNQAAAGKAMNMFSENYWAHYSPSGKDPWDFITGAGYKFTHAGENLAKNFGTSEDVVRAWMNSPSHRDNILNPNYQEIGIAVEDGVLQGQSTTLVVQMFGKPAQAVAVAPPTEQVPGAQQPSQAQNVATQFEPREVRVEQESPSLAQERPLSLPASLGSATLQSKVEPLINPITVTKNFSFLMIALIGTLLVIDYIVLKRRGVFRFSSHHFAHMSLLTLSGSAILTSTGGELLPALSIVMT